MQIIETNNEDQYEVFKENDDDNVIDVVINRKRFDRIKDLHLDKYKNGEFFWEMFERDLFDTDK